MNIAELITLINLESNEILDDRAEYIPYINAAIDYMSWLLVQAKDAEVIKSAVIKDGSIVPSNFVAFVPKDGYPVTIFNGSFSTYCGKDVNCYYGICKNHVANEDDLVPFSDQYVFSLVQIISFLVKKKSLMLDYANFDKGFIGDVMQNLANAKGG